MKPPAIVALTALAALALPAPAGAKEISKVEICGEERCRTLGGAASVRGLIGPGEPMSRPPAAPGPYYRVTLTAKHEEGTESWSIFYVPSASRLALPEGQWEQLARPTAAAYQDATAGLEPYPTPALESVTVDGLPVDDPSSYLALYTAGTSEGAVPSARADWVPVELRFRGATPWSGPPSIFFSPADGLIQRGIEMVRISDAMAADVRARESIAGDQRFPWLLAAASAAALALLGAGFAWLALRREVLPRARRATMPT